MRTGTVWGLALVASLAFAFDATAQVDLSMLRFDVVESSATGTGSPLTLEFEIQNTGAAASGAFTVRFYYSDNTGFNPNNPASFPVIGSAAVPAIPAGGTSGLLTTTATLTDYALNGTRLVHYFVDPDNDVAETNENNNRSTQITDPAADEDDVLITGLPNLQASITALSAPSGTLGDVITISYQVFNVGATRAPFSFWTHFYLSTDALFDTGDFDLGRENEGSSLLLAGGSFTETFDVTIPPEQAAGAYFLLAYADRLTTGGTVTESDESDNVDAAAFTVTPGPDLVMDTFSYTATPSGGTLGYGDAVSFSFTVRNQGGGAAGPFTIYFYYDDDATLAFPYTGGSLNQPVFGTYTVGGGLAAGATLSDVAATSLPGEVLLGDRFLHYYIDAGDNNTTTQGVVYEADEGNNTGSSPITITGLPDLTVDAFCAVPQSQPASACGPTPDVVQGAAFSTYSRFANIGKSRVASVRARLYFSTDPAIDPATDTFLNTSITGPLLAGGFMPSATGLLRRDAVVPASAPGGVNYAGAYADFDDFTAESDETNNGSSAALNVLSPPDLVMDSFSIATGTASPDGTPSAPGFGSTVDVTFSVRNQGATDAGSFAVRFYYKDDQANPGSGTFIATQTISALAAGAATASATVSGTLPANVLHGLNANGVARYIHYHIDPFSQVVEDDETNNTGFTPIDITGQPELEVLRTCLFLSGTPLECSDDPGYTPPSQVPGGPLFSTLTVRNNGLTRAPALNIGLYFSTDATIETGDVLVNTLNANINAGGLYFPNSFQIAVPGTAAPGPAFFGYFADHDAQIPESDETNNTDAAAFTVASSIDLTMASFSAPDAQGSGSSVTLSYEVANGGVNNAGAFLVRFFYDDDADPASGQTTLGTCTVSGVPGGGTSGPQTCAVTLPATVLFGTRFIHYVLDVNGAVTESDETNNTGMGGFQVTGRPDLAFAAFTASPSELMPGEPTTVDYTFFNGGASRTGTALTTRIYYSDDPLLDPSTDDLLDTATLAAPLAANAQHVYSVTVTIPPAASPAGGTLFGVVDADGAIAEENEGNNTVNTSVLLPVELTAFEALLDGAAVLLRWETASETNNAGFEVQRRGATPADSAWAVLGFVEGAGTVETPRYYQYRADGQPPGRYRFRLKQIDFDGTVAYSPEVETTVEITTAYVLSPVFPQPFRGAARFTLAIRHPQRVRIAVYDVQGRLVARLFDGRLEAHRTYTFTLDGRRWASGLYVYAAEGERFRAAGTAVLAR